MFVLLTIFGCLYHASGIPVDSRNISLVVLTPNNEVNDFTTAEDIKNAVSQVMATLKSNNKSADLIEAIIDEVELQLSRDPSLPRLTRGEILDLIENITKSDLEELEKINKSRTPHQRAVMLVLPYSPKNNTDDSLQELYTRPPIIKIIDDNTEKPKSNAGNNLQELYTKPPVLKIIDDQVNRPEMKPVRRRRPTLPPTIPQIDTSSTTAPSMNFNNFVTVAQQNIKEEEQKISFEPTTQTTAFNIIKQSKLPPVKKYPVKPFNKQTTPKYYETNYYLSQGQGLNVIPPPKFHLPPAYIQQEISQVPDEILIAQESLPPKASESYSPNDFHIPNYSKPDVIANKKNENEITYKKPAPTASEQFAATTPVSDMASVADNLTPEMKKLLMSFGLIPDPKDKPVIFKPEAIYMEPEKPNVEPESFIQFKPLPDSAPTREDMATFLEGFGFEARDSKHNKEGKGNQKKEDLAPREIEIDIFPDEVKGIITDLGLTDRKSKKIDLEGIEKYEKKSSSAQNKYDRELEELNKLKELIDFIKKIDTMNDTELIQEADLKKVKDLVTSLNQNDNPAQPNANKIIDVSKITVKRQANKTVTEPVAKEEESVSTNLKTAEDDSSSSSDESLSKGSSSEEETPTTTTAASTPNLKDLEDSFGGTSEATTTTTTEPAPTTRKSGFYHLVDWNTFLEVDDQKGRKVNIRFQPRSGDPKRFYSVTVP
ncbi:uncharacterized protein LOC108742890 [Agrilus planipennis]|uniref:Uncharacterized protein LOC108742890 n=1 Tax=Agrilus planipennis TaxID=224129 RepID=A0A1W4XC89_AGRPL|nr:uncharacterized protein LOC108742890 [Agrilus planipennis]